MTFKINRVRAVVKLYVRAKFHPARCSGSWIIVVTGGGETRTNTVQSVATAQTVTMQN